MTSESRYVVTHLGDDELVQRLRSLVGNCHQIQADLLAHLAEVDARRLYREAACASMFTYCVEILHFSESTAYKRITAARAARRFPRIFELVAAGELHLSAVCLLAPHLSAANHEGLLRAAVHKTKRETDELVAAYFPRPAAPVLVRRLPAAVPAPASPAAGLGPALATAVVGSVAATRVVGSAAAPAAACPEPAAAALGPAAPPVPATWMATPAPAPWTAPPARPPAAVTPLGAERYKVQFTAPRSLRDKLKEAQDLLGHAVPPGDVAAVFERALDTLLKDLRRKKHGEAMAPRPRPAARRRAGWTRHLPRATRREVAARDERRCAYVDPATGKRCSATTGLEFHHLEPWARGGSDEPSNVVLACRAHNGLAAERDFGASFMARRIGSVRATGARPGETAGGPPAAVCAGSPPPVGRAGEPGLAGRAGGPGLAGRAGKPGLAGRAGGPGLAGRAGGPGLAGRAGGPLPGVRRDGLLPAGRAGGPPPEVRRDGLLPAGRAGGPGSAGRAGEGRGQPDAVTGSGGSPARMAATALEARAAGAAGPDG